MLIPLGNKRPGRSVRTAHLCAATFFSDSDNERKSKHIYSRTWDALQPSQEDAPGVFTIRLHHFRHEFAVEAPGPHTATASWRSDPRRILEVASVIERHRLLTRKDCMAYLHGQLEVPIR